MVRQYCSFLVRCWSLANGERRVRVEHVQTGEVLHTVRLEEALAWIDARAARSAQMDTSDPRFTESLEHGSPEIPQER